MSDKTKMLADQALTRARMIEWWKREKAKPKFDPRCKRCGKPGPWAVHRDWGVGDGKTKAAHPKVNGFCNARGGRTALENISLPRPNIQPDLGASNDIVKTWITRQDTAPYLRWSASDRMLY